MLSNWTEKNMLYWYWSVLAEQPTSKGEVYMTTVQNIGEAVLSSLNSALALVFTFIPKFIGFLVILLVGWLVANADYNTDHLNS